jgi:hypothetical protein
VFLVVMTLVNAQNLDSIGITFYYISNNILLVFYFFYYPHLCPLFSLLYSELETRENPSAFLREKRQRSFSYFPLFTLNFTVKIFSTFLGLKSPNICRRSFVVVQSEKLGPKNTENFGMKVPIFCSFHR